MADVRTFVAVHLPADLRRALAGTQERLRRGPGGRAGRWVRPESIHLTLKFLGDVPATRLDAVYRAVASACAGRASFDLPVAGYGCFPNSRRPRVVWAGLRDTPGGELLALQGAVEAAWAAAGFERDSRPFQAHLTLARINDRAGQSEAVALGAAVEALAAAASGALGHIPVARVSVMSSELRPEGPRYAELYGVDLEAAPGGGHG
jgi:2'-5' RNA ligase